MAIEATMTPELYTETIHGTRVVVNAERSWGTQKMAKAVVDGGVVESSIIFGPNGDWTADQYEALARWAETVANEMRAQAEEAAPDPAHQEEDQS